VSMLIDEAHPGISDDPTSGSSMMISRSSDSSPMSLVGALDDEREALCSSMRSPPSSFYP
jgi:hypothetical protein